LFNQNQLLTTEFNKFQRHLRTGSGQGVGGSNPLSPTNLSLAHSAACVALAARISSYLWVRARQPVRAAWVQRGGYTEERWQGPKLPPPVYPTFFITRTKRSMRNYGAAFGAQPGRSIRSAFAAVCETTLSTPCCPNLRSLRMFAVLLLAYNTRLVALSEPWQPQ